ncbi:hypothetical protein SAZ10_25290 [Mesorhizobium sp. BAC0120]|uniref:hypothetical protein n=1 Tax=Mesorhizobium sp. BAC0120 TaxID=3090670 RepID=UPI00298D0C78|nr:hypothetical protein [Mesorhizobium sp. BAC0120]MDW6025077.1 hypothetical protein [Mesorhizobium sp. BAC0120]
MNDKSDSALKKAMEALDRSNKAKDDAVNMLTMIINARKVALGKLDLIRKPATSEADALEAAKMASEKGKEAGDAYNKLETAANTAKKEAEVARTAAGELPQANNIIAQVADAEDAAEQAVQDAKPLVQQAEHAAKLATNLAHPKKPA